jgi:hypothetical protein
MFGFWGFPSFDKSDSKGGIPNPVEGESAQWGHALVVGKEFPVLQMSLSALILFTELSL